MVKAVKLDHFVDYAKDADIPHHIYRGTTLYYY